MATLAAPEEQATLTAGEPARMYALAGVARAGAARAGYISGEVFISIAGSHVGFGRSSPAVGTILGTLTIASELDETPDRCSFRVNGWVPPVLSSVLVTLGSKNSYRRLFAGQILEVSQHYAMVPRHVQADVSAVDHTWQLGFSKRVTARYRGFSATEIARDLITTYAAANGFTSRNVVDGLPALDDITYTDEDVPSALTRLARRIGAYWYCDYWKDVHLFFTETGSGAPVDLTPSHKSLDEFTSQLEASQGLTRVYVEGQGTTVVGRVEIGETRIPVESTAPFVVASDVSLKATFAGAEGGAQYLAFGGITAGGAGTIVGPGIGPGGAPAVAVVAGAGSVNQGTHDYGVTFTTAAGESLISPTVRGSVGGVTDPSVPIANLRNVVTGSPSGWSGRMTWGDQCFFKYSYGTGTFASQTLTGPQVGPITVVSNQDPLNPTNSAPIYMDVPSSPDPRVKDIYVYIWANSTPVWQMTAIVPNAPGYYVQAVVVGYGSVGYNPPSSNTTILSRVDVSGIAIGGPGVTGRKLYRTAANLTGPLRLLATLADNTTTTYTDTLADASLGANAPASDTSGLQQAAGQVTAGSSSIPVAGTGAFSSAGGWAVIGNGDQVIRYTGITGSSLTGIPASGTGAITATIAYNSTITQAGMLTGIPASGGGSVRVALESGDELYVIVQTDDPAAQTALAGLVGGTGIREDWVQDRRLSVAEARARGQATLRIRPLTPQRISYTSRDLRTTVGKDITVNLPAPTNVSGTFRIQRVTVDDFRPHKTQYPRFRVEAASGRFSFEDWLRRLRAQE